MDLCSLEGLVQSYFACGLAKRTQTSYVSGQKRYLAFCEAYNLTPLPLSESNLCLFSAFLAHQGLQAQTVSSYLSALRHLQVSAGFSAPNRSDWPRLQYTLKGIQRSQAPIPKRRMPITSHIMAHLLSAWQSGIEDDYETRLLWAAACLAFFGFLRSGEFAAETSTTPPSIQVSGVSIDSRTAPSVVSIHLRKAKTDPFGRGITVYLGKTGRDLCPVAAILNFLAVRPPTKPDAHLFVHNNGSPLLKSQFVTGVRRALSAAHFDSAQYSGHSFRIGAATSAAAAGVPDHLIKTLGRWESSAYHIYIRTPRESLAAISPLLVSMPNQQAMAEPPSGTSPLQSQTPEPLQLPPPSSS